MQVPAGRRIWLPPWTVTRKWFLWAGTSTTEQKPTWFQLRQETKWSVSAPTSLQPFSMNLFVAITTASQSPLTTSTALATRARPPLSRPVRTNQIWLLEATYAELIWKVADTASSIFFRAVHASGDLRHAGLHLQHRRGKLGFLQRLRLLHGYPADRHRRLGGLHVRNQHVQRYRPDMWVQLLCVSHSFQPAM